jgi:small redox-active disulfide protein 2
MAFFNFNKKKSSKKNECNCCECYPDRNKSLHISSENVNTHTLEIIGSGCKSCHELYENTKTAVSNLKIDASIEYITDLRKLAQYGIMSTPALVADGVVISSGRLLSVSEIEKILIKTFS